MVKMVGYMITWTTYGTWLQGEEKGYVKDGKVLVKNKNLKRANQASQKEKTVRLTKQNRKVATEAILGEAKRLGQKIYSMAVCSNHVHIVVDGIDETIGVIVGRYKRAAAAALKTNGLTGKVWTRGYDKRYCFDENSLKERIKYVRKHD